MSGSWEKTACILCECNCGLEVQLGGEGNRHFTRIRGDKAHPASKGYACEMTAKGQPDCQPTDATKNQSTHKIVASGGGAFGCAVGGAGAPSGRPPLIPWVLWAGLLFVLRPRRRVSASRPGQEGRHVG